jgi:hypothetical protein
MVYEAGNCQERTFEGNDYADLLGSTEIEIGSCFRRKYDSFAGMHQPARACSSEFGISDQAFAQLLVVALTRASAPDTG